ncbi:MAG: hypothetical protein V8T53_09415 [Eubacteriales bacterium]
MTAGCRPPQTRSAFTKNTQSRKPQSASLAKQINLGEIELEYVRSANDALSRAETGAELAEIRDELWRSGYAGKQKTPPPKKLKSVPAEFVTSGGYTVLCGRNNLQNDELTFRRRRLLGYMVPRQGRAGIARGAGLRR